MNSVSHYELAWELYNANVPITLIAKKIKKHRSTIHRWISRIKLVGIRQFIREQRNAKKRMRKKRLDLRLEPLVVEIRRDKEWCGEKIIWFLDKVYQIKASLSSVYRILRKHFILRSKWKKNQKRGPVPTAQRPRQVLQADTIDLGELFVLTVIDIYTREGLALPLTSLKAYETARALKDVIAYFGEVDILQTDNGSELKREFAKLTKTFTKRHRRIRPYQKDENAYVESFNRTVRKQAVGWGQYRLKDLKYLTETLNKFNYEYNHETPHLSLNLEIPYEYALKVSHLV